MSENTQVKLPWLKLAPEAWPGGAQHEPGDLTKFAPMGNGVGLVPVVLPWGGPATASGSVKPYGLHPHMPHPLEGAPPTEGTGGTVYLDSPVSKADFEALLRLLQVRATSSYAAFLLEAPSPPGRWRTQVRLVSSFGLDFLFKVDKNPEGDALREQSMALPEALWAFVEHFQLAVRDRSYSLEGWLEGDGDWADEGLGFGLSVENSYFGIFRIWTRPWLVTK